MYCKKCGTEQKDGQKFCPKCGEPFLDENGKPYLKGIKKDLQDAKDKLASKADELTQQGKKLVDEKVQPQLNEKFEEIKNIDWSKKKVAVSSYVYGIYRRLTNAGTTNKVIVVGCVLLSVLLLFGTFKCSNSNNLLFQGKSSKEELIASLDNPSTAFAVRIDYSLGGGSGVYGYVEVPEGQGSKDKSYIWTLIFFPENESKTSGRAILEPWLIDRDAWANGSSRTYRYEVRDEIVDLYSGYIRPNLMNGWTRCDDLRLYIEKVDETITLRGEFLRKERVFKQTIYKAASDKANHYFSN